MKFVKEVNILVIFYDCFIFNSLVSYYFMFDNVKVGEVQVQYVVDCLLKDCIVCIVCIYGVFIDNNVKMFKQGQDNVFELFIKVGKIQVVFEDWVIDWKFDVVKKIMNVVIIKVGINIDVVVVFNDGIVGGVIQVLCEEGFVGKIIVIGQDVDFVVCQCI